MLRKVAAERNFTDVEWEILGMLHEKNKLGRGRGRSGVEKKWAKR